MFTKKSSTMTQWIIHRTLVVCLFLILGGCATATFNRPDNFDSAALRSRAETSIEDDIRVSAAIPSREESIAIFGIDLPERKIQPVWLEIVNNSDRRLHFLRTGLDPEYFSPREVAFAFQGSLSDDDKQRLSQHLESLDFINPIDAQSTVSGFVFTNEDRETKFVSVDLLSRGWSSHLTLLVPTPDRALSDDRLAMIQSTISEANPVHIEDESRLRTLLEKLPCCTADENGIQGEPLNVVLIGNLEATGPALLRRHFRYTRTSPLYVFGRPQDVALKKGFRWIPAQPHVVRFWVTNMRFHGKLVWIGQISMPLGGRFAGSAGDRSSAVIDPDVDAARADLVQDAIYSQLLNEIGYVKGVGPAARSSPRPTPGGSTYHTDGLRAVLIFDRQPVSLTEIEFMSWEPLTDQNR